MKEDKEKKILIYGHEIGGQMQLIAETLRKRGFHATAIAINDDFRGYKNDINLSSRKGYNHWNQFWFTNWAIRHFDVFHFFWGVSLFSFKRWHLLDLPLLKRLGKKVIVHFRGLDIVDINFFDYRRAVSRGEDLVKPPISRKDQLIKLKKWKRFADYVLVSEPDLFEITGNEAILSPQVIDTSYWISEKLPISDQDGIFRVVHAPTSRRKKGTEFVEKAVSDLHEAGYNIQLILAENYESHKIRELYEKADVGIDQLLYGWHGKVSVELMSMGKPVICYIDPELKKYREELPIISSNPREIKKDLRKMLNKEIDSKKIGDQSRRYASKYHNIETEIDRLLGYYGFEIKNLRNENQLEGIQKW